MATISGVAPGPAVSAMPWQVQAVSIQRMVIASRSRAF
jgi:hypothetical protein